jgi:hypothetical protein
MNYDTFSLCPHELRIVTLNPHELPFCAQNPHSVSQRPIRSSNWCIPLTIIIFMWNSKLMYVIVAYIMFEQKQPMTLSYIQYLRGVALFCFFWHIHIRGGRRIRTIDLCFIRHDPNRLNYLLGMESHVF